MIIDIIQDHQERVILMHTDTYVIPFAIRTDYTSCPGVSAMVVYRSVQPDGGPRILSLAYAGITIPTRTLAWLNNELAVQRMRYISFTQCAKENDPRGPGIQLTVDVVLEAGAKPSLVQYWLSPNSVRKLP